MFFPRFTKDEKRGKSTETVASENADNSTIERFSPKSFEDVEDIIDRLVGGEPAIVSLSLVRADTAQRVVDLLSGATYAIGGNLSRLENDLYVFTPGGTKIVKR